MPPKSKKQQELQAQRLQQQRKKKEQQEAKQAALRKKYASQTLENGLVLLYTQSFLLEALAQTDQFVQKILDDYIDSLNLPSTLPRKSKRLFVQDQFYALQFAFETFGIKKNLKLQKSVSPVQINKARIFLGIVHAIFFKDYKSFESSNAKSAESDWAYLQELLVFCLKQVQSILKYMRIGYFQHYNLLKAYKSTLQQELTETQYVAVDFPTPFESLSEGLYLDMSKKS